jgi:hypothetical protein
MAFQDASRIGDPESYHAMLEKYAGLIDSMYESPAEKFFV